MAHLPADLVIDIDKDNKVNNYDDVRRRSPSSSNVFSRNISVVSKASSIPYHERIVINNNTSDEEFREPIDSSQLLYKDKSQANSHVNMVINPISPQESHYVSNKALALNISNLLCIDDDDVINIQLLYNPNQLTEPNL